MIDLWTIHSPKFDIRTGRVDHNKSDYYPDDSGVKEAYQELWKRLNIPDGQIIWCYTKNDSMVKPGTKKIRWQLKIPHEKVICFIDSLVWNRILGKECYVGKTLSRKWKKEAFKNNPEDTASYTKKFCKEFWNQKPKTGSWWDELFVDNSGECVDALIHHPVPKEFVNKKPIPWCCS